MVTRMPSLRSRSNSAKRGSITTGEQEQRAQMFHCGTTRQPCSKYLGGGGRLHRPNRQGMRRAKHKLHEATQPLLHDMPLMARIASQIVVQSLVCTGSLSTEPPSSGRL